MRLRSLAPAQRWAAGTPLVEESGDALLTNQAMQSVTKFCTKEGSDARTNRIASCHHATLKVPQSLVFPPIFCCQEFMMRRLYECGNATVFSLRITFTEGYMSLGLYVTTSK